MAFLYVPAKMKRAPFTLSGDTDACFARSETVCDTHAVSTFYFWNLTNADAVVAGTAPLRSARSVRSSCTRARRRNPTSRSTARAKTA